MKKKPALKRLTSLLSLDKKEITSIYFFAILSGLVQLTLPLGVQSIIGLITGTTMVTSIYILIGIVIVGILMVGIMQINQMQIIEKIQQRIFTRYAYAFSHTIPHLKLNKINDYYLPEKATRFFDTITLQKGLSKILLDIPIASIQVIFGLTLLALYHPVFIFLGMLLLLVLGLMLKFTAMQGLTTSIEESDHKYKVAGWLQEVARVIIPFKFSSKYSHNVTEADYNVSNYLKARTAHFKILVFQYKVLVAFKVIVSAFLLSIGTYLVIKQQINIGEFIAAEIVILTVIGAVEKLISSLDSVYDVIAGIEKIESVTELQTEKGGTLQLENENKGISLNLIDVSYEYLPNKKAVNHINLAIPSNAKVGINGENGSGKATLIKLLATCYDNYTGQILVNGLSLSNYELKALRSNISLHVNNNDLFLGTVLQNISMGNALVDTNKILALARQLGFQDVLQQFSNGFDTVLDPAGKKLSQSTTKKLLLLRAFANQGKLIILNDPWRSLSYTDKQNIVNYINTLNNTTVIVVTTDEDYLNQCTHVLTLSKGTVLSYKTN